MRDELVRTVAELYEEHRQAAFPRRLVVDDANGVEMVTLCSNVSGCVHTWLSNGGSIDNRRWDVLADCEHKLNRAVPALDGSAVAGAVRSRQRCLRSTLCGHLRVVGAAVTALAEGVVDATAMTLGNLAKRTGRTPTGSGSVGRFLIHSVGH